MRKALMLLILASLGGALVVAGCGGDDDDGGEALTKEEFIAQGDENCARADDELQVAFETTRGDEIMDVGMVAHLAGPGLEHADHADLTAKKARVLG